MLGAACSPRLLSGSSSGIVSVEIGVAALGSSGIVSLESGLAELAGLLVDSLAGDLTPREVGVLDLEPETIGVFRGLVGVAREDVVGGLLGGKEAVPPKVARLVLSVLGSGLDVRDALVPMVVVLGGRLYSSPSAEATEAASSMPLPAGLRADEVTGRAGGLLTVLPDVRDANALGLLVAGDTGVLVFVVSLEAAVVGFFASSVDPGLARGFAPVVFRLSISTLYTTTTKVATTIIAVQLVCMLKQCFNLYENNAVELVVQSWLLAGRSVCGVLSCFCPLTSIGASLARLPETSPRLAKRILLRMAGIHLTNH